MLDHGGRLRAAAQQYDIPLSQWLDLSTGISPFSYADEIAETLQISSDIWRRLPEEDDGLEAAAADFYGAPYLLPTAGSQAAIQLLPTMRDKSKVGVIAPSYNEHEHSWRKAGHEVTIYDPNEIYRWAERLDVLILPNPNNPTGQIVDRATLLNTAAILAKKGGWLIVDEAFCDESTEGNNRSLADASGECESLIVLKSLGKFFGLAGARVGFVLSSRSLLLNLREKLGPWSLTGPSRLMARLALEDTAWSKLQKSKLKESSSRLKELLASEGLPSSGTTLFQWFKNEQAPEIHRALAQKGILTRLFQEPASLRIGLPGSEADWQRLAEAIRSLDTQKTMALTSEVVNYEIRSAGLS